MHSKVSKGILARKADPARIFAVRLKVSRIDLGLRQTTFGELIGVAGTRVSDYERGRRLPDLRTLARIARELDVSIDWLLGLTTS